MILVMGWQWHAKGQNNHKTVEYSCHMSMILNLGNVANIARDSRVNTLQIWLPWEWQVPKAEDGKGVSVRVVAGTALGISSPVRTITPTYYLGIVTMMAFTVPLTSVLPPVPSLPLGYGETTIIAFFLDFRITPGGKHVQDIPDGWTAFVYTLQVPVTFLISQDLQIWTLSTCPISYLYLFHG